VRRITWLLLAGTAVFGCRAERLRPEPKVEREPLGTPTGSVRKAPLALPPPASSGTMSVEQALSMRRSRREFDPTALGMSDLGQLAWAAQGISDPREGFRTAPSAGALYPLELYFVTGAGVWHYVPNGHSFEPRSDRDLRRELSRAALDQEAVRSAPCDVVITSVTGRTRKKYGERATRFVAIEAGHVAENLLLQATARGLVGVPVGGMDDEAVSRVLGLAPAEEPLYLVAIGRPRQ
jgi:SagB-type dehydrogenase family enzyme